MKHTHDNHILLKDAAKHWDLSKWSQECSKLSPEQLVDMTSLATPEEDAEGWKKKLHLILMNFPPQLSLESLGRVLNVSQILELLQFLSTPANHLMSRQQLSSLFVGLSPFIFREVISQAAEQQLYFFKEEAVTEVIQHHLSLIVNDLNEEFKILCTEIETSEAVLQAIFLDQLNTQEIEALYINIDRLSDKASSLLNLANQSLVIAWNSNRVDLIQELGLIKERCQRCLREYIGHESENGQALTGLRHRLNEKINLLFSDQDAHGHISLMKDSTPALEALVKFSIWYVQDYEKIGLLPELEFNPTQADAKNLKRREELLAVAERNLNDLGLHTLRDLKEAKIYSKQSLIEYISAKKVFL